MPLRLRPLLIGLLLLTSAAPAEAIVGGTETVRDWPHMAAMEFQGPGDESFSFRCGGSLVRPDVVLTAAHCVDGDQDSGEPDTFAASSFRFVLGTRDREEGGERISVVQVVEHPEWDNGKDSHDVALLKLARPTSLGAPIRIADQADAAGFGPGDPATIIGWGATFSGGGAVRMLREAEVPIVADDDCAQSYSVTASFDAPTSICAGNLLGGKDSCQGDSGGPLMVPGADGRFVLVGDTSFGVGCAFPTQYGVYGEVAGSVLRPWIEARLQELSPQTAPPGPGAGPLVTPALPVVGAEQPTGEPTALAPVAPRVTLPRVLGSARRARARGRLAFRVRTTAPLRRLRATLHDGGRAVAVGRRARLSAASGRVVLRLRAPVRAGRARLSLTARDRSGRTVRVARRVTVRR